MDDWDIFTPMFDETLHDNDVEVSYYKNRKCCAYCGTIFPSRNKLFYHLGFQNININKSISYTHCEDIELGDYGFTDKRLPNYKKHKKRYSYRLRSKMKRKYKKRDMKLVASLLSDLQI